jgi:hypothetical protein
MTYRRALAIRQAKAPGSFTVNNIGNLAEKGPVNNIGIVLER